RDGTAQVVHDPDLHAFEWLTHRVVQGPLVVHATCGDRATRLGQPVPGEHALHAEDLVDLPHEIRRDVRGGHHHQPERGEIEGCPQGVVDHVDEHRGGADH